MGKIIDWLMHPMSQLALLGCTLFWLGILWSDLPVAAVQPPATVMTTGGLAVAMQPAPTVIPPTFTAIPSATPTLTLIPTSTPWPTDTPTAIPTATWTPLPPPPTATLIPWPPTATPRVVMPEPPGAVCPCNNGDVDNCRDFRSQEDAQACFAYCVAQGKGDVHGLDEGFNNRACVYLPAATALPPTATPFVPTPTPAIVVPTVTSVDQLAIQEYAVKITSIMDMYINAFNQIGILFGQIEDNPSLLLTDSWKLQVAFQLSAIGVAGDMLRGLHAPPSLQPVHELLLQAVGHYDTAATLIAQGIDELNIQKILQAIEHMEAGNNSLQQAKQVGEAIFQ